MLPRARGGRMAHNASMYELFVAIGVVVVMTRVAAFESFSTWLWGGVTVLLEIGAIALVPLPFFRVFIAGGVAFAAMFVYKLVGNPKQPFS